MRLPINSASVREILLRHDPVAAWPEAGARDDGYADAAELAASSLRNMLGVGHVWTVVADASRRYGIQFVETTHAAARCNRFPRCRPSLETGEYCRAPRRAVAAAWPA